MKASVRALEATAPEPDAAVGTVVITIEDHTVSLLFADKVIELAFFKVNSMS